MDHKQVFVVMGTLGEYSDKYEWPVAAYFDRAKADKHADLAMEWSVKNRGPDWYNNCQDPWDKKYQATPYDPNHGESYGLPADYYVIEVSILDEIPRAPQSDEVTP
jgi:hypothetical protein